jgi:hypothetical protein
MLMAAKRREILSFRDTITEALIGAYVTIRVLAIVGCVFAGPAVVGYQIYDWLNTGHWHGIALLDWITPSVVPVPDFWQWVAEPHSWYGLHRVVIFSISDLPAWSWLVLFCYLINPRMEITDTWIELRAKSLQTAASKE